QGRVDIVEANPAVQPWVQSGPSQVDVADRFAVREISANQKWVLGLDLDIEFPIAQRRLRNGKARTRCRRLGSRTSRQTNWKQIEVLQELTIRHRYRPADVGAVERCDNFEIGIGARGQRIVA